MASLTKIDVVNQALIKAGADPIASLDTTQLSDQGEIRSATLAGVLYDQALAEILRMHTWNCCTARAQLVRLQDSPAFGYDYAYQLPADFNRLIRAFDNTSNQVNSTMWVIEGDQLLCDYDAIYIKYVKTPSSVGVLDPLALRAVICHLASKLVVGLQLDIDWATRLTNELQQVILPEARSTDTFENKELLVETSEWIKARVNQYPYAG